MSDENEFVSEDENNERSVSDTGQETSSFEDVGVDTPQAREGSDTTSVGLVDRDVDEAVDSDRLPIEEQIEEVRIDNESVGEGESLVKPRAEPSRKRAKGRKTRKSTSKLTGATPKETLAPPKLESSAIETFQTQINERLRLNEQKLAEIMSTVRPLKKHIPSTAKQVQISRQIQSQVKQLQKQVQQIEKMSKNISAEIKKRSNKESAYTLQKKASRSGAIGKSKRNIKAGPGKSSKASRRRKL